MLHTVLGAGDTAVKETRLSVELPLLWGKDGEEINKYPGLSHVIGVQ